MGRKSARIVGSCAPCEIALFPRTIKRKIRRLDLRLNITAFVFVIGIWQWRIAGQTQRTANITNDLRVKRQWKLRIQNRLGQIECRDSGWVQFHLCGRRQVIQQIELTSPFRPDIIGAHKITKQIEFQLMINGRYIHQIRFVIRLIDRQ